MKKINESIIESQAMAKAKGQTLELKEFTIEQAEEILCNYFKKYQGVDTHVKSTEAFVKKHGYAMSVYGYKRRVPAALSSAKDEHSPEQERAVRQAVNFTIQNPASVSLLLSICNLQEEIDELGIDALLIASIHDAAYLQVSEESLVQVKDLLIKHMTVPPVANCPVPIRAEAEWGKDWASFSEDFSEDSLSALAEDSEDEDDEELQEAA